MQVAVASPVVWVKLVIAFAPVRYGVKLDCCVSKMNAPDEFVVAPCDIAAYVVCNVFGVGAC